MEQTPVRDVANWLDSCRTRFKRMYDAGIDKEGWPRIEEAIKHFETTGNFTVGQIQYLFNRSHPMGALPGYNTHKKYNLRHGEMRRCPVKSLIDSNLIDWSSGKNGVMQAPFANAIRAETNYEWYRANLRPKTTTTYEDLFGKMTPRH